MSYDGFFLCGHHVDPAQSQSDGMSIEEWLKTVASGNHPKFPFPAKEEGPDLPFVLGKDKERVLCVLQVYTLTQPCSLISLKTKSSKLEEPSIRGQNSKRQLTLL